MSLEDNIIFLHLWYMVCNGTYESKKYFCAIFRILLEGHVVQLRITFNKDIESQLNDRKYQIYLEIIQTPTWQLICCLLHLKNVFIVFNIVYVQVASQRCLNFLFLKKLLHISFSGAGLNLVWPPASFFGPMALAQKFHTVNWRYYPSSSSNPYIF